MKAGGVLAALIATFFEILPALIIGIAISKLLKKFSDNFFVKSALWALKPVSCALLSYVAIKLFYQNIISNQNILIGGIIFTVLLIQSLIKTKDPLWYISLTAVTGIILVKIGLI